MVLQRDAPVSIWGTAQPGATVYATLTSLFTNATFNAQGAVGSSGDWVVSFPPQPAGGEWRLAVSDAPEADPAKCDQYEYYCVGAFAEISNIAFGDVIECIG